MNTRRQVVDYALQRRALLAEVRTGRVSATEACDAHPYLQRAAKYHGVVSDTSCPVCRKDRLTHVHYVYGDELRHMSGQAKSPRELPQLETVHGEFSVYVVEVCPTCGWNHLTVSFVLGHGSPREASPRRRRQAAQE